MPKYYTYHRNWLYIRKVFSQDVTFYYSVLALIGIKYCFTKTDAVFVWTKGGYQISRSKEYYPIFIKIQVQDKNTFDYYVHNLGLRVNGKKGIFFHPEFVQDFQVEKCETIPVDSLEATIAFMERHAFNFQPALEMV